MDAQIIRRIAQPSYDAVARSRYYRIQLSIVLSFGLTELQAQVVWQEKVI